MTTVFHPTAAIYERCQGSVAALRLDHLALVEVEGRDAADLLQRVTSQDVVGLPVAMSARATILDGKGKLLALFEVFRLDEGSFLLEVQRDRASALAALIDRYVFAEDVRVSVLDHEGLARVGPEVAAPTSAVRREGAGFDLCSMAWSAEAARSWAQRSWLPKADFAEALAAITTTVGGLDEFHALRIDAGLPYLGLDADPKTIPLEVGLDDACDAKKGCYPGQEIVARIRTYGHVNRLLCRVHVDATAAEVEQASALFDEDGDEAGRLTSAFALPSGGGLHALAMLPRALASAGTQLRFAAPDGRLASVR